MSGGESSEAHFKAGVADRPERLLEIAIEALRGLKRACWDQTAVRERIRNQVVMVTGAAGSVGSELCRQIGRLEPLGLVGMDQAETPLYFLREELAHRLAGGSFHPVLGNVQSSRDLEQTLTRYEPSIVFHAAAYKHVAMLEEQIGAAVENNILATRRLARAAIRHGVESVVLISTDKAVRPASIMGATKRVAELLVRSFSSREGTKFSAVRFGNVLGSSGSVVPNFRDQIAAGGPVTIRHAEMQRYFTTAEEAAQFVLQALLLSAGGEVFLLDMGEPVRIVDLALKVIDLADVEPGRKIGIEFKGMLQGEKLSEELKLECEQQIATGHARISRVASARDIEEARLEGLLDRLEEAFEARDAARMRAWIQALVPEFGTAGQIVSAT